MTNIEAMPRYEVSVDRDSFRHRNHLLEIAEGVARQKQHVVRPDEGHDREYMYLMIDAAKEQGYEINNVEAIEFLEKALEKNLEDDRMESNIRDGTWDENGNPIEYDEHGAEVTTGENDD